RGGVASVRKAGAAEERGVLRVTEPVIVPQELKFKFWWIWSDAEITDLWSNCIHDNATGNWLCAASNENDWLQAVQSLTVLSVVFSSVSFLVFLGQLFTMSKGGLFYFTGLCQVFAGFTSFAACLIFTFHRKKILDDTRDLSIGHFGYCFILAWSCVPLLLFSGVLYVHLRKRQ
uniref:Epithelial membrane protein 3 n=1 Tax=Oncorhynchus tshawytscha TaxID=74940 RepID=A0A8C8HKR7_ONCTS